MDNKLLIKTAILLIAIPLFIFAQEETESAEQPTDSPYYWEQIGFEDGKGSLGLKTIFAGAGGCVLGGVGGGLIGPPTALTAGVGGSVGCLGGWGIGALFQQEPVIPSSASLECQDAYMRGYNRGKSRSNAVPLIVGTATTLTAIVATAFLWSYYYY